MKKLLIRIYRKWKGQCVTCGTKRRLLFRGPSMFFFGPSEPYCPKCEPDVLAYSEAVKKAWFPRGCAQQESGKE